MRTGAPVPLGGSFATLTIAAAGVTTMLAAASNTKGCWLRSYTMEPNAVGVSGQLYLDTAAPAAADDLTKRRVLHVLAPGAGGVDATLPYQMWLPAGVGIFVANLGGSSLRASATWDLVA
jgi:hypothetical protein